MNTTETQARPMDGTIDEIMLIDRQLHMIRGRVRSLQSTATDHETLVALVRLETRLEHAALDCGDVTIAQNRAYA